VTREVPTEVIKAEDAAKAVTLSVDTLAETVTKTLVNRMMHFVPLAETTIAVGVALVHDQDLLTVTDTTGLLGGSDAIEMILKTEANTGNVMGNENVVGATVAAEMVVEEEALRAKSKIKHLNLS